MDERSQTAISLLRILCSIDRQFADLALSLSSHGNVLGVVRNLATFQFESWKELNFTTEFELLNRHVVCGSLEILFDRTDADAWLVKASVRVNGDQGQDTIREFGDRFIGNFEELLAQLPLVALELTGFFRGLELSAL
jgi:hypothetical protein